MKKKKIRSLLCFMMAVLMLSLTACSTSEEGSDDKEATEVLLPVSISGIEIKVGETTIQSLLDQGLEISWVDEEYNRIVVDPTTELEAKTYYTGGSINLSDNVFFKVSFVTDEKKVPLGEAVIAYIELHVLPDGDQSLLDQIAFDGVPFKEMTQKKAVERYPDWSGDEIMWLNYGTDYKYLLTFDIATGDLTGFTVERNYDVDWTKK